MPPRRDTSFADGEAARGHRRPDASDPHKVDEASLLIGSWSWAGRGGYDLIGVLCGR